jgi:hypothetical protein
MARKQEEENRDYSFGAYSFVSLLERYDRLIALEQSFPTDHLPEGSH